jgi:hypothetical protein
MRFSDFNDELQNRTREAGGKCTWIKYHLETTILLFKIIKNKRDSRLLDNFPKH